MAFTPIEYIVNTPSVTGGTVTSNPTQALPGARVALDVAPSAGYKLDTLTVTDANGNNIELYDAYADPFVVPTSAQMGTGSERAYKPRWHIPVIFACLKPMSL